MTHVINTIIILAFTSLIYFRHPNIKPSDDFWLFVIIFTSTIMSIINILKMVHKKKL